MPTTKNQKSTRGIPRKASNAARHAKQNRYLARATCIRCHLVFRSPKFFAFHVAHGHQVLDGVNKQRCTLEHWNLLTQSGAIAL